MIRRLTPAYSIFLLSLAIVPTTAQITHIRNIETSVTSSFRGLSVIDDEMAWVSGSNGWIGHSHNGGKNWRFIQIPGYENLGFRSIYAFSEQKVIVANAGSPANILLTEDHGVTWDTVYTNDHKDAFFDGIDFWNETSGLIYGDPIDGKMLLLSTSDGGKTWKDISNSPTLKEGEASFAASGTGIRCMGENKAIIATGGLVSRLFVSEDQGNSWSTLSPPIIQNENTSGIFSFAVHDSTITVVGGDYKIPLKSLKHNLVSHDNGKTWQSPEVPTRGYRECVEFINNNTWIATGPTGADISYDNGNNWKPLFDNEGFHVVRKARNGSLLLIAGDKGQIGIVE